MRLNCVGQHRGTGWWRPPVYGVWLGKRGEWGFTISQLHSVPWWQKGGEGIRERPPLAESKPKDVCSAGLRKASECVWCESTQYCNPKASLTHTHRHTCKHQARFGWSIQWTHAVPTRTLGLKVLFILVTGCGSGVILLQYWVTTTTLMPPFKFNSWPNFCYLAPQREGAPAFMRQQQSYFATVCKLSDSFLFTTHSLSWSPLG